MAEAEVVSPQIARLMGDVLNYDVLLEEILSKLDAVSLKKCEKVSTFWTDVCRQVDAKKRTTIHAVYPFRMLRFEEDAIMAAACSGLKAQALPTICPAPVAKWLADVKPHLDIGTDDVIQRLLQVISNAYAKPELIILTEANNTKVRKVTHPSPVRVVIIRRQLI